SEESGTAEAAPLDIEKLADTVFTEPINAAYDPQTQKATAHTVGKSIDKAEAKKLWDAASSGDRVVIPLTLTQPEITTELLNSRLFAEVLSQKSTSLGGSSAARVNNIKKAAAAINGIVLNPGDEFSYNGALGQRTAAAGYQGAGAYSGGKVVTEIGGGICQVSSTLYYCTLIANLQITQRSCHYFAV
ncbi:MAG: VanW family protein, partial [Oscillospiraceae bacterium]